MPSLRRKLLITLAAAPYWTAALARPAAPGSAAPELLLPTVYDKHIDPAPYLVSEKYDGVRALWDGVRLRFRSGREVPAPGWFTARLPRQTLDGELWLGRGRFDELSGTVRQEPARDDAWKRVRYMVFELPGAPGSFAERAGRIAELARQAGWPQLQAVAQTRAPDRAGLQRRLADTVAQGGEGLVLHLAAAPYRTGRSDVLVKLKPMQDTEATVVAHHAGQGKYKGLLGALQVQTPEGRRFLIGTGLPDALRRNPPPLGSVITYRYRDLTSTGLPRFASFLRVHDAL